MKKVRSINFMHGGKIHCAYSNSIGEAEVIGFFNRNGYKNYPKLEVNETIPRYWDSYFEVWFGGYVASDQIWARSVEEAYAIDAYLRANP